MRAQSRLLDTLLLLFALTGGAGAWTLQLWLSWALAEPLCQLQPGELRLAGLDTEALWLLVGVGMATLAAAALLVSTVIWRGTREQVDHRQPRASGSRRFVAYVGLVLNGLFLLTVLLGTTSPLFLAACR